MQKSILLVTSEFPPGPGGIGTHAFHLAKYLNEAGYAVEVLTEDREEYPDHKPMLFRVEYVPRNSRWGRAKFLMRTFIRIVRGPRVIMASGRKSLMATSVGLLLGKRLIGVLHGHELLMGSKVQRVLLGFMLRRFTHVVAVSAFSKSVSMPFLAGKDVVVIPNGIAIDERRKCEAKYIPSGSLKLLTVGTVSKRKGQHNVLKLLPEIIKQYPYVQYTIAGTIREPETIFPLVESLGLTAHVHVRGVVSNLVLERLYQDADIVIMLSENQPNGDVEGFGISILEGNNFGVPAIGSLGCGIEQAIENDFSGILIDPHSSIELKYAIAEILKRYSEFSENSLVWASRHSWKNLVEIYASLIE
ncbi:MAG: glycosyltransferase family 4 protein [Cyclobacteriaceae bacterium]|nr:glycosyltransferase family 4 protein [Cyclobacteriaceae bacterium]